MDALLDANKAAGEEADGNYTRILRAFFFFLVFKNDSENTVDSESVQ